MAEPFAPTAPPPTPAPAPVVPVTPAPAPFVPTNGNAPAAWYSDLFKSDGAINHESFNRLPENRRHLVPTLSNLKTGDDLIAKLDNLSILAGKKGLGPLPPNSPPEAIAERNALMREVNGVPEKPEGYGLAKPQDLPDTAWNQKAAEAAAAVAHKHNLPPAALKELVQTQIESAKEQIAAHEQGLRNYVAEQDKLFRAELTKDGINYDRAVDQVAKAAQKFGISTESPLMQYADFKLLLQRVAVATGEPEMVTGQAPNAPTGINLEAAAKDIVHNKANPKYEAYWNPSHPNNRAVKAEVLEMQAEFARQQQARMARR